MMNTQNARSRVCAALCVTAVFVISRGTLYELRWRGNFADTGILLRPSRIYLRSLAADAGQNTLSARTIPVLCLISRHSLGIYGFHALIIHALRTNSIELKNWPPLDMLWIFSATLAGSLLLSVLLQRIDTRRLVS